MPRLFAIDSMAILYRGYFAMIRNPLINSQGINTSGIYGFLNQLVRIIEAEKPDYLAVVADTPDPTFRHRKFPAYKATREKMPEDLVEQLPYLPRLVNALNLPYLILSGYEADDIVGTLMRMCSEQGLEGVMVTSDKDYMQLVSKHNVMLNHEGKFLGEDAVLEKFGGPPSQVIEVLGLMGDSSDNVPGVRGIGEKTAKKLIQQYGSIDEVYAHLEDIKGKKLKENLIIGQDSAYLSRELVTIDCQVPLDLNLEALQFNHTELYKNSEFHEILGELEFKSFLKRFQSGSIVSKNDPDPVSKVKTTYNIVDSLESFKALEKQLETAKCIAFDLSATGSNPVDDRITGIAFCMETGSAFFLPIQSQELFSYRNEIQSFLNKIFGSRHLRKIGHNLKLANQLLQCEDINVQGMEFDTMIAAHLVDSERDHSLAKLAIRKLRRERFHQRESAGKNQQLVMIESDSIAHYNYHCENADLIFQLYQMLQNQLSQTNMLSSFQHIEMPLVKVLADMEITGVSFDQRNVQEIAEDLEERLEELSNSIYKEADETFNINSVIELQQVLYEKLALHKACGVRPKKIKLGNGMSTDEETLEKMSKYPLPHMILRYRELNKLKNTYVDQLPTFVNRTTQRIHSSFRQTVAATGRLASDKPNLQNIPIRKIDGQRIRKLFIPSSDDHVLISADYSQIELRIVAHYSKDPVFLEAYHQNLDIHALTASAIFNVSLEQVNREMRSAAKEVNFGLIYRMGPERLAIVTQTSRNEAKQFIEKYFQKYATIHALQELFLEQARKEGYASTLMGRRRYLPDINGKGLAKRMAEGAAINTPIQGSAAEIIKMAMVAIHHRLKEEELQARMILTVHDELVFDTLQTDQDRICILVKEEMENVVDLEVPLVTEIGTGQNWLEAH